MYTLIMPPGSLPHAAAAKLLRPRDRWRELLIKCVSRSAGVAAVGPRPFRSWVRFSARFPPFFVPVGVRVFRFISSDSLEIRVPVDRSDQLLNCSIEKKKKNRDFFYLYPSRRLWAHKFTPNRSSYRTFFRRYAVTIFIISTVNFRNNILCDHSIRTEWSVGKSVGRLFFFFPRLQNPK